jgi:hypothetical protein
VPDQLPAGVDRDLVVVVEQDALTDPDTPEVYGFRLLLGARVPDVVGQSLTDAVDDIAAAGLTAVTRRTQDPDDLLVVEQSPAPDTLLRLGEPVQLTVAPAVRVPDVVDLSLDEATEIVESQGLTIAASGGGDRPGPVVSQEPEPGEVVAAGSLVEVRLAALGLLVAVPDLTDADVDTAGQRLAAAGLTLEATIEGDPAEARVVSQSPSAGTLVEPGTLVVVRLAAVVVPTDDGLPWQELGVVLLAMALVAGLLWRPVRQVRERRWVRRHITCRGDAGVASPPFAERPDDDVCTAVRLELHPDPGRQELEEVRS